MKGPILKAVTVAHVETSQGCQVRQQRQNLSWCIYNITASMQTDLPQTLQPCIALTIYVQYYIHYMKLMLFMHNHEDSRC